MTDARTELRRDDVAAFFDTPFAVYDAAEPYVSPMRTDLSRLLDTRANPAFEREDDLAVFTAHRDGRPLGRITAHVHRASNRLHGLSRAYFGHFDCADDPVAAGVLLGAAEGWARDRGFGELVGNVELTAMQQMGVQTSGFGALPYTDQHCNPAHVPRLLERHGYTRDFPMRTFECDLAALDPEHLLGPAQRAILADEAYRFAPLTRRTLGERLGDAHGLLNAAFANNPMFVPLGREEFDFQSGEMRWIMDRRISAVLHHRGEAIGTVICIPDLNGFVRASRSRIGLATPWHFLRHRLRRERAVLIYYAVAPERHGRGIAGVLLHRVTGEMRRAGYRSLGCTWIGEGNPASLRQMDKLGARTLHELHLYRKRLDDGRRVGDRA